VATTDAAGVAQSELTYEPFGNTEMSAPAPAYRFTGREHDEPFYLYYYRARYYDTDLQRFISEDPIGLSGGIQTCMRTRGTIHFRSETPSVFAVTPAVRAFVIASTPTSHTRQSGHLYLAKETGGVQRLTATVRSERVSSLSGWKLLQSRRYIGVLDSWHTGPSRFS